MQKTGKYDVFAKWDGVPDTLLDIKEILRDDKLPPANEAHDLNAYYYERLKVETENLDYRGK